MGTVSANPDYIDCMPKHRERNIGIAVAVVVVAAIIALATVGATSTSVNITGSNLSISYTGATSGYLGPSSQALGGVVSVAEGGQFTYTITLTSSAFLLTHLINSMSIATPGFTLVSILPNLPYTLTPSSSLTITLTMQAPNTSYNGPIGILMSTS